MDEKELRTFLVKEPRGAKILFRDDGDDVHEVKGPGPGSKGGSSWAAVARSILAMNPQLVEVHAEDGSIIRATRTNEPVKSSLANAGEANLPVLHVDPETARLTHFANLLFRAHEFATGTAFTKMTELFGMVNERMIALETRLERAESNYRREMQTRLDEAFDRADDLAAEAERVSKEGAPGDPLTMFAQQFMAGRAEASAAPNGKGSA